MNKYVDGLVSVIIPVFNSEKFIEETLKSVLNQTYKDIQIVIVDDFSTDKSEQLIKKVVPNNLNHIFIKNSSNFGAAVSRNEALKIANGRYVAFLDSDDIWSLNKIELQIDHMKKNNHNFSYTAINIIDETNIMIKPKRSIIESVTYGQLLKNTVIATSTVIIDRFYFGHFEMPLYRGAQDYATWLKLLNKTKSARGLDIDLVSYRKRYNSLSSNKINSIKQIWTIQRKQEKIFVPIVITNILFIIFNSIRKSYLK